jgi:hypothetical protein
MQMSGELTLGAAFIQFTQSKKPLKAGNCP